MHIIAHSFGGLVSRTYLQRLARGFNLTDLGNYERHAKSLVTLGTPHSGIADTTDTSMYGVLFPKDRIHRVLNWGSN